MRKKFRVITCFSLMAFAMMISCFYWKSKNTEDLHNDHLTTEDENIFEADLDNC